MIQTPIQPCRAPSSLGRRCREGAATALIRLLSLLLAIGLLWGAPAWAGLDDDRYDGNIFALYAGNGSLVPPRSTLAEARAAGRVVVLIFYLDDSAVSKRFAPVVSELQRQWGNSIELIPLVTDPLQERPLQGADDPARYWKGSIPQVVVLDASGKVLFDRSGALSAGEINQAISRATGIALTPAAASTTTMSFNELNSEVIPSRP
ncbi:MAG: thylakoid membrane photosystem I accumulation factor [Cyanobium sp.]